MEIGLLFAMFKVKSVYLYYRFSISKRKRKVKRGFRKERYKKISNLHNRFKLVCYNYGQEVRYE